MELPTELKSIEGAQQLQQWFGYWPSFHDAEVLALHLNRSAPSTLAVHTWETTNQVDEKGYFVMERHVVVEFALKEVSELNVSGFNHQNVISSLTIDKLPEGFRLTLIDCYGLAGTIEASELSIRLIPGKPSDAHF
jgi:hypothetical protein